MKSLNSIFMMLLNKSVFPWQGKVILLFKYKAEKKKNKKIRKMLNSVQLIPISRALLLVLICFTLDPQRGT